MHKTVQHTKSRFSFTTKILIGMIAGVVVGYILQLLPQSQFIDKNITNGLFDVGGRIFIAVLKMLVVPIVFVSLVCGTCQMSDNRKMGKLALKTFVLYVVTTAIAITIAIFIANLLDIGTGLNFTTTDTFHTNELPSVQDTIVNIIPSNPIEAMAKGNMLQIIVFAMLFGYAISIAGHSGRTFARFFNDANNILMKMINIVLWFAPYGVFCLLGKLFASQGLVVIGGLAGYFFTILLALLVQWFVVYGSFIRLFAGLNPFIFFKKMYAAMLFAFSTSSSSASIPVVLDTAENKMGVHNSIASFVIPVGSTVNMDGTSIMQGVATVFISHIYNIDIGIAGYLMVILTATLASIGTAGVPSVGLVTLTMVLNQVGLPAEGVALIIGVDRLLDMARTAVNISGDCMVSIVVGKSEKEFNEHIYQSKIDENKTTAEQIKNWRE